jgi:hypothetical protein
MDFTICKIKPQSSAAVTSTGGHTATPADSGMANTATILGQMSPLDPMHSTLVRAQRVHMAWVQEMVQQERQIAI